MDSAKTRLSTPEFPRYPNSVVRAADGRQLLRFRSGAKPNAKWPFREFIVSFYGMEQHNAGQYVASSFCDSVLNAVAPAIAVSSSYPADFNIGQL